MGRWSKRNHNIGKYCSTKAPASNKSIGNGKHNGRGKSLEKVTTRAMMIAKIEAIVSTMSSHLTVYNISGNNGEGGIEDDNK